ncbi:hypothetical protein BDV18DRAFT_138953 [Aspergillus unguis]
MMQRSASPRCRHTVTAGLSLARTSCQLCTSNIQLSYSGKEQSSALESVEDTSQLGEHKTLHKDSSIRHGRGCLKNSPRGRKKKRKKEARSGRQVS